MAIRLTTSFVDTNRPGSYVHTTVRNLASGIAATTGVVAILGEAADGEHYSNERLADNSFAPDQVSQVADKYGSGPILDAMQALSAPSTGPDIQGGANSIVILKTNSGTKSSAALASSYGTLNALSAGVAGNQITHKITASQSEVAPTVTSNLIADLNTAAPTPEIFTATFSAASLMTTGQHMLLNAAGDTTQYYAWFNIDAGGGDPAVSGRTGIPVAITSLDTAPTVAAAYQAAVDALATFTATVLSNVVTVTTATGNETTNASNVDVGGLTVATTQQGGLYDASALNGLSFTVRPNGGAATVVTLSATESDHDSAAELAAEIDAQLPATLNCVAGTGARIVIYADVDATANQKGWGKSFELIDSTPGDLAAIGLTAGMTTSAQEPAVETSIVDATTQTEELTEATPLVALSLGYAGTTATATLNSSRILTTTVTGGSGANLIVDTSTFATLKALADYIQSQTGYSASADPAVAQRSPSTLDQVTAIGIASPAAKPGRIKNALQSFKNAMSTSTYVSFTAAATAGLPDVVASATYLAGGLRGATTSADIADALLKLEGVQVNFVVPLFSRDAADDIADGLTDAASTYTIDAIHAATRTHCLKLSTPKMKRRRSAMLSYKGTFSDAKQKVGQIATFRTSLAIQDVKQGSNTFQPWYLSAIAAGMQAAGFYQAIFNKGANVSSLVDPVGFDSGSPGDVEEAIEASLLIAEQTNAGVSIIADQTTYGVDDNFVYNSIQAVYAADIIAQDIGAFLQQRFVGQSLADVEAATVASAVADRCNQYKRLKLIASSDDAVLGYRGISVSIQGVVVYVKLEVKLSTAIRFLPVELEISAVQSTATA